MQPPDIAWRETWPDEDHPDDIVAHHGSTYVGRVYCRVPSGFSPHLWQWNTAWGGPHRSGLCGSRREAMLELETRYEARLAEIEASGKGRG